LAALDASGIRYLVVGGIAVGFHGEPRYTKDLDVLITVDRAEAEGLYACLKDFGAPVHVLTAEELSKPDFIFHFGVPPWRIDIISSIPGVEFEQAYADRVKMPLGGYAADCISREWLIKAKVASGRPQDLLDLKALGE
jgi:hypothetical protein